MSFVIGAYVISTWQESEFGNEIWKLRGESEPIEQEPRGILM